MPDDTNIPDFVPYLLPEEKITSVEFPEIKLPEKLLNYGEALCLLCKVKKIEDLGKNGPPLASIFPSGNENVLSLRLYEAVFGRDSLYMSDHLLLEFPIVAKTTLLFLASMQGL